MEEQMKFQTPVEREENFDPTLLENWKSGDYSMLINSGTSEYIKKR
jgi:hypothetical protein